MSQFHFRVRVRLRLRSALVLAALAALVLGVRPTAHADTEDGDAAALPVVTFTTADGNSAALEVEVADTEELRVCGLMHRLSMPDDQAMLFVYTEDEPPWPYWNRNTFVPLSLAWLAADGTVLAVTDLPAMDPAIPVDDQTPALTGPGVSYRFVIEANMGWYAAHGVQAGDHADVTAAVAHGSAGAVPICREEGS